MTEQEVEAMVLVARLTRIWTPERFSVDGHFLGNSWVSPLEYHAQLSAGVHLDIIGDGYLNESNKSHSLYLRDFSLHCFQDSSNGYSTLSITPSREEPPPHVITDPWLALFTRNCWLSGCPVEATAHEKAEWMQGLSPEEIEAWNLKI